MATPGMPPLPPQIARQQQPTAPPAQPMAQMFSPLAAADAAIQRAVEPLKETIDLLQVGLPSAAVFVMEGIKGLAQAKKMIDQARSQEQTGEAVGAPAASEDALSA